MIKKIILTFILFCLVLSCGKKGDPVYKESNKKDKAQNIEISII
tara:strand:+ start:579 stop:710 length:132 start_codon:yes stop_codon:yes gene_type:complete